MHTIPRTAAIILLAASLTACEESPLAPQLQADPVMAELLMADQQAESYQPLLPRLFREALARIARTEGPEVAKEIAEEIKRLHQAAATAQEAGNIELAQRLIEEARIQMATITVRAFGPGVVNRVLGFAHQKLDRLQTRIRALEARGLEVPPALADVVQAAAGLLAAARAEQANGNAPGALLFAAEAVDLLARIRS